MDARYSARTRGESALIRLTAPNPSPMTERGTNTYLIGQDDLAVIDPGPADLPDHRQAICDAVAGRPVRAILVTHSHLDHSPGAAPLAGQLDAPVLAFGPSHAGRSPVMERLDGLIDGGEGVHASFQPDALLADGEEVRGSGWTLRAHHTPGHMANHLSFEWVEQAEVFTGDVVMGWASTLISPPDGDLGQFMASLDRLGDLGAARFHPGHGPSIDTPAARCADLRRHRLSRQEAILTHLTKSARIPDLVAAIYAETPPALHAAAARNVLAHLIFLAEQGAVTARPQIGPDAFWLRE